MSGRVRLGSEDFAQYRDERLKQVSIKSLKRQLSPIHNMFEVARDEWGLPIRENPLDKVKLKAVDNRRERRPTMRLFDASGDMLIVVSVDSGYCGNQAFLSRRTFLRYV